MAWSKVSVKKFSLKDKSVRTRKVGQKTNKILNAKHLKVGTHCTSKNPNHQWRKLRKKNQFHKNSQKHQKKEEILVIEVKTRLKTKEV